MTKITSFPDGLPCWLDANVESHRERQGLIDFYSTLFGWNFEVGSPDAGFYSIAYLNGSPILALASNLAEKANG